MHVSRYARLLIAGLLALLVAAPVLGAVAAKPDERVVEPVDVFFDRPDLSDICGFPVAQTLVGENRFSLFFDAAGDVVEVRAHIHLDGAFIANGKTLPFIIRQNIRSVANPDGSFTDTISGIQGRLVLPGQGVVGATVGRMVLHFPAGGGDPTIIFQAGKDNGSAFFGSPGSPGILCGLLAA